MKKEVITAAGLTLTSENGFLIIEFLVGGTLHRFRLTALDAIELAKAMRKLFLSKPRKGV